MNFGSFLKMKRQEKGKTLRGLADEVNIAPSYLSDIEKGKRNSPTRDILNKIVNALTLTENEACDFYDLAAKEKNRIADDITDYISANSAVRLALRKAKNLNLGEEDWIKILTEMEK